MNEKRVKKILDELQRKGLVEKIWSEKRQDFVYGKTELGKQVYKELQACKTKKGKRSA